MTLPVIDRVRVPLVRLDDVIPSGIAIGLLKIDVQGAELAVLEGAEVSLRSTFALLLEVNTSPITRVARPLMPCTKLFGSHGFRTFGVSAPYGGKDGPMWADALFVQDATRR